MALININKLTFSYEGSYDDVFRDASFQIDTDWKLGLIGRNGYGKTTLLRLLMNEYPYSGTISSEMKFEYFPYKIKDKTMLTGDIIDSILHSYEEWELNRELNLLNVASDVIYRPFDTLSNGEQTKVLLAVLFMRENSFLLIDEPTNHLDIEARRNIAEYLKKKKSFIIVSHDRMLLDACIDHVLAITKQKIEVQKGNFSTWWQNKKFRDEYEAEQNEKLKKDINRMEIAAKQTSKWSDKVEKSIHDGTKISGIKPDKGYLGHKSAKMMKRSKSLQKRQEKMIDDKETLLQDIEHMADLKLHPLNYHSDTLLRFQNVSVNYGNKIICSGIDFEIKPNDLISLQGPNGSGKSSILKLITEGGIKYEGNIQVGSKLKISYVQQDSSDLSGSLKNYAERYEISESLFKAILIKLNFPRKQFEKDIGEFSAGQKKKTLIARSLCEEAHLYIWDEPLNYIDIISRMQIEKLLEIYKPTLLFVEHDRTFCENIATKVVTLE